MTTDNIIPLVRNINILLAETTYQNMSDDEIDAIISYEKDLSYQNGYTQARIDMQADEYNSILEKSNETANMLVEMMHEIHNTMPQFINLDFGGDD